MVQVGERVDSAMNGSMKAVAGSGMANMSEASIDFQPRMEEPSKPRPSLKESSFNSSKGRVKCCQVPKVSTNFTSTILAPAFLAISNTCLGVLMDRLCPILQCIWFNEQKSPSLKPGSEGRID